METNKMAGKCECGHSMMQHSNQKGLVMCSARGDTATENYQGGMTCKCLSYRPAPAETPSGEDAGMVDRRTAWMIERTSVLWGHEWFCAGEERWTKDPNKTIQFPDKGSAVEVWERVLGEVKKFPYSEEGVNGEWVYTYHITEHAWLAAAQTASLAARVEELEEVVVKAYRLAQDNWSAQCYCFTSAPEHVRRGAHETARDGFNELVGILSVDACQKIKEQRAALAAADSGEGEK